MNNPGGVLGGIFEQTGELLKETGKGVINAPKDIVKTAAGQVTGIEQPIQSTPETKQFVKGLYEPSHPVVPGASTEQFKSEKKVEEAQKIARLQKMLHSEYSGSLQSPAKPQPRVTERLEQEKYEQIQEFRQNEARKPQPISVSNERFKTERGRVMAG